MKGAIYICLAQLVKEKFDEEKWSCILNKSGLDHKINVLSTQDIEDAIVLKVIDSTCNVLNLTLVQAADAFGDYWMNIYAPKTYGVYFRKANTAKEFLLNMDTIHETETKNISNARQPRFEYKWENGKTLIIIYKSKRGLVDFLVGLVRGVGKYFKQDLEVTKISNDRVRVVFDR